MKTLACASGWYTEIHNPTKLITGSIIARRFEFRPVERIEGASRIVVDLNHLQNRDERFRVSRSTFHQPRFALV